MTYIIFDLEWVATFYKGQMPEIISIGAVKVRQRDNGKFVEMDSFDSFVRPQKAKRLNKKTIRLTGIKPQDVETEGDFPTVWKKFIKWMGDDYYLLSWGTEDIRNAIRNCKHYRVTTDWLQNYNDLQAEFGRLNKLQNQAGLMQALEMLKLEPVGRHHSAVDDARNTAEVFKECLPRLRLERGHPMQLLRKYDPTRKSRRVATTRTRPAATTATAKTTKSGKAKPAVARNKPAADAAPQKKKFATAKRNRTRTA